MNQQDNNKAPKQENQAAKEPSITKVATNPNLRANENLKDKSQQATNPDKSSSSEINSEITDGEDA